MVWSVVKCRHTLQGVGHLWKQLLIVSPAPGSLRSMSQTRLLVKKDQLKIRFGDPAFCSYRMSTGACVSSRLWLPGSSMYRQSKVVYVHNLSRFLPHSLLWNFYSIYYIVASACSQGFGIVRDAVFEPRTAAAAVWWFTIKPPHPHEWLFPWALIIFRRFSTLIKIDQWLVFSFCNISYGTLS